MPDPNTPPGVPESRTVVKKKTRLSLVWIVPIVAALVGAWVAVTRILSEGPTITIVFKSAEGLEAGKTKIHYNGVDVGTITTIRLSDDHQRVIATAQMAPKTEDFLVEDTKFWVVRPRDLRRHRLRAGHPHLRGLHRHGDRQLAQEEARVRGARHATGRDQRRPGPLLRAEDAGPRLARQRHADLLPAAAGRRGRVVRARQGRPVLERQGVRERALRPVRQPGHALLARERDRRVALRERPQRADAVGALAS